eukprot:5597783-Prymnesium_polylepis.1
MDGVYEALGIVAHLRGEAHCARNKVVEVLLNDLGGEAHAKLGELQADVEADVKVVREEQVHRMHILGGGRSIQWSWRGGRGGQQELRQRHLGRSTRSRRLY